jgi:F420-0:gamma-glutamyl ligase-like protein
MSELKAMCESLKPETPLASKAEAETETITPVAEIAIEEKPEAEAEKAVDEVLEEKPEAEAEKPESIKAVKTAKNGWGDEYKF